MKLLPAFIILFVSIKITLAQPESETVCLTRPILDRNKPVYDLADSTKSRGTFDPNKKWETGLTLAVRFLNGTDFQKQKVRYYLPLWSQHGNIKFSFTETGRGDLRVLFNDRGINKSYVGKDALLVTQPNMPTIELSFNELSTEEAVRRYVLHEFGHAIGLMHEHLSPLIDLKWNYDSVYSFYSRANRWDKETVDMNVLNRLGSFYSNGKYDPRSIMHYYIPPSLTTDNRSVGWNTYLSEGDKETIAEMYPASSITSTPPTRRKPSCTDFCAAPLFIKENKIQIAPVFSIANGRDYELTVVAYFFDQSGSPLSSFTSPYKSVSNKLITWSPIIPCCESTEYNKQSVFEFYLTIPLQQFNFPVGTTPIQFSIGIWSGDSLLHQTKNYPVSITIY